MTDTSTAAKPVAARKLTLEVAAFNWRSARVQFALGYCLVLIFSALLLQEFFATRFLVTEYLHVGDLLSTLDAASGLRNAVPFAASPVAALEVTAFEHHSWLYRTTTFVVTAATAMLAGLIHFDTILRFGNRTGAGAAIFCALLLLTMPFGNGVTLPETTLTVLLSQFAGLCAMYLDMRARLLKESSFLFAALIMMLLSGLLDAHGVALAFTGIICQRFMLPDSDRFKKTKQSESFLKAIPAVYLCIALGFILPNCVAQGWSLKMPEAAEFWLSGETDEISSVRIFHKVMPALLATVSGIALLRATIGSLWLRPFLFSALWLTALFLLGTAPGVFSSEYPVTLYLAPPICILLSAAALPCIDTLNRRMRIILTTLGSLALSLMIVIFGCVTAQVLHQHCVEARDLSFFKVELARHFASTGGRLVVVNPPFANIDCDSRKQRKTVMSKDSPTLAEIRDRDAILYQSMLNSPLSNQKSPITVLRKIPSAFVRLAHEAAPQESSPAGKVTDYYAWDKGARQLMPVYYVGSGALQLNLTDPSVIAKMKNDPTIVRVKDGEWAEIPRGKAYIEIGEHGIRLNPSESEELSIWFSHQSLDPTKVTGIIVKTDAGTKGDGTLSLLFKGTEDEDVDAIPFRRVGDTYVAETRGVSEWHKHKSIVAIGIKLSAGSPAVVLSSVESAAGRKTHGN